MISLEYLRHFLGSSYIYSEGRFLKLQHSQERTTIGGNILECLSGSNYPRYQEGTTEFVELMTRHRRRSELDMNESETI